jgi:hypothetical protein
LHLAGGGAQDEQPLTSSKMKTRYLVALSLFIIAILTCVVFLVSSYVQPLLPTDVNSTLLLWIAALLGVLGVLSLFKDVVELAERLTSGTKDKQHFIIRCFPK